MKVYFGLDFPSMRAKTEILLGMRQFPILVSASALWQFKPGKLWRPKLPPHKELLLDSGAFALLTGKEKNFPFSFEDYAKVADDLNADLIAARDWPCEPWGKIALSVKERIERTVAADIEIVDRFPDRGLVVVQGWTARDYVDCIDLLRDQGLADRKIVAVGSCCRRTDIHEVMGIARAVRRELPGTKVHYFGLKIQALRQPGFVNLADSTDTTAWLLSGSFMASWTAEGTCSF